MNKYYINTINFKIEVEGEIIKIKDVYRPLAIHNIDNNFIITDILTGLKISEGNTKEESTNNFNNQLSTYNNWIINKASECEENFNKKLTELEFNTCIEKFDKIFNISFYSFIEPLIYGLTKAIYLDIIKFEGLFKNELDYSNISLKDYIKLKYGIEAMEVISKLSRIKNY